MIAEQGVGVILWFAGLAPLEKGVTGAHMAYLVRPNDGEAGGDGRAGCGHRRRYRYHEHHFNDGNTSWRGELCRLQAAGVAMAVAESINVSGEGVSQ